MRRGHYGEHSWGSRGGVHDSPLPESSGDCQDYENLARFMVEQLTKETVEPFQPTFQWPATDEKMNDLSKRWDAFAERFKAMRLQSSPALGMMIQSYKDKIAELEEKLERADTIREPIADRMMKRVRESNPTLKSMDLAQVKEKLEKQSQNAQAIMKRMFEKKEGELLAAIQGLEAQIDGLSKALHESQEEASTHQRHAQACHQKMEDLERRLQEPLPSPPSTPASVDVSGYIRRIAELERRIAERPASGAAAAPAVVIKKAPQLPGPGTEAAVQGLKDRIAALEADVERYRSLVSGEGGTDVQRCYEVMYEKLKAMGEDDPCRPPRGVDEILADMVRWATVESQNVDSHTVDQMIEKLNNELRASKEYADRRTANKNAIVAFVEKHGDDVRRAMLQDLKISAPFPPDPSTGYAPAFASELKGGFPKKAMPAKNTSEKKPDEAPKLTLAQLRGKEPPKPNVEARPEARRFPGPGDLLNAVKLYYNITLESVQWVAIEEARDFLEDNDPIPATSILAGMEEQLLALKPLKAKGVPWQNYGKLHDLILGPARRRLDVLISHQEFMRLYTQEPPQPNSEGLTIHDVYKVVLYTNRGLWVNNRFPFWSEDMDEDCRRFFEEHWDLARLALLPVSGAKQVLSLPTERLVALTLSHTKWNKVRDNVFFLSAFLKSISRASVPLSEYMDQNVTALTKIFKNYASKAKTCVGSGMGSVQLPELHDIPV